MNPYEIEKLEQETELLLKQGDRRNSLIFLSLVSGLGLYLVGLVAFLDYLATAIHRYFGG